jgi:hypothetical protein
LHAFDTIPGPSNDDARDLNTTELARKVSIGAVVQGDVELKSHEHLGDPGAGRPTKTTGKLYVYFLLQQMS